MHRFSARSHLPQPPDQVFDWHTRMGAPQRLTPPWQGVELERHEGVGVGKHTIFRLQGGLRWVARISDVEPGAMFRDTMERGPFSHWVHTHRFLPGAPAGTQMLDELEYALPAGLIGDALGRRSADDVLRRTFRFRPERLRSNLLRHHLYRDRAPLKIAISGASGMVGTALRAFLETAGHTVIPIVREPTPTPHIAWRPLEGRIEAEKFHDIDAVVHLAGEGLFSLRWSTAKKRRIRQSRVEGTALLARTLAALPHPPRVFVCASAVGYYGDRGDEQLHETAAPGAGFLAEVCRDWEAAADPAREAGIRTVHLRFGVILSALGGALPLMVRGARLGFGGTLGTGEQSFPWVALDDVLGAVLWSIRELAEGPVNVAAPQILSQGDFMATLREVVGGLASHIAAGVPATILRATAGDMARELLLASAHVVPGVLQDRGFAFHYGDLRGALAFELGRSPADDRIAFTSDTEPIVDAA